MVFKPRAISLKRANSELLSNVILLGVNLPNACIIALYSVSAEKLSILVATRYLNFKNLMFLCSFALITKAKGNPPFAFVFVEKIPFKLLFANNHC